MTYGVTAAGFVRPRLVDIQQRIFSVLQQKVGAQINQLPESLWSQVVGTFAGELDEAWQAAEDAYNSAYPDLAFGVSLDNAAQLTGAVRKGPLASTVVGQRLFGIPGTLIAAGKQIAVNGSPASIFATANDVTLVAGQNCQQTLTPLRTPTAGTWQVSLGGSTTGVLAYNISAADLQTALQALTFGAGILVTGSMAAGFLVVFAGDAGLQEQPKLVVTSLLQDITGDITVAVTITVAGVDQGSVNLTATTTGALVAPAGQLSQIVTPVNGWTRTLNPTDAAVGRDTESDNAFKQRRREELQVAGDATSDAIRSKLLALTDVSAAIVFENDTNVVDGAGRPPKSIECMVEGGADQEILDTVFETKAAGIQTVGNVTGTSTDSSGQVHAVAFSRPAAVLIYIKITVTTNPSFPATGVAAIQEALVTFGNALGIGKEVVVTPYLISSIAGIVGIEDAVLLIGTAPNPTTSDNVAIAPNQVASFDTSRIQCITV